MKLTELQLKRDLQRAEEPISGNGFQPGQQVKGVFRKYGWNLLGAGLEGAVAEHPTKNQILKLFINDSPYKNFVQMAQHHPNPHFPKFFKHSRDIPGTKFSYVLMEKLTPLANIDALIDNYLGEMYVLDIEGEHAGIVAIPGDLGSWIVDETFEVANRFKDNPYNTMAFGKLNVEPPGNEWITACRIMCNIGKSLGLKNLDLGKANNFMLRGQTLVITDPFVFAIA